VYYFVLDRPQIALMKFYNIRVLWNRADWQLLRLWNW